MQILISMSLAVILAMSSAGQSKTFIGKGKSVFSSATLGKTYSSAFACKDHSTALRADGALEAWGNWGALGGSLPSLPAGATVVELSASFSSHAALLGDGSIFLWGGGLAASVSPPPGQAVVDLDVRDQFVAVLTSGSLLEGTADFAYVTNPPQGRTFVAASRGTGFRLALLDDGSISANGSNFFGECDVPPLPPGTLYVSVEAGDGFSLALRSDGVIVAWGDNSSGQCDPPTLPPARSVVDLSAGSFCAAAVLDNGEIVTWGGDYYGLLSVPGLPPGQSFVHVDVGPEHAVAIMSSGQMVAWGRNQDFQCGLFAPPSGVDSIEHLQSSSSHAIAILSDGSLYGWGPTQYGLQDFPLAPPGTTFIQALAGSHYSAALSSDGSISCWGDSSLDKTAVPDLPHGAKCERLISNHNRDSYSVALLDDGSAISWGNATVAQDSIPSLPTGVQFEDFAIGLHHSAAVLSNGTAIAWGANAQGECDVPDPGPSAHFMRIAAGWYFTCALLSDGTILAWGQNDKGQCDVPELPPGLVYQSVHTSEQGGLALRSDGILVSWGFDPSETLSWPTPELGQQIASISPGDPPIVTHSLLDCGGQIDLCAPAAPNSVSQTGAKLDLGSCLSIAVGSLSVDVMDLPVNQPGLLIYSADSGLTPFGNGYLCLSGNVVRVPSSYSTSVAGSVHLDLDLATPPFDAGVGALTPGSTWGFQFWYRDPLDGFWEFNLSNVVHVVFAP